MVSLALSAVLGLVASALVATAVYFANEWAARDRNAISLHESLTTGEIEVARHLFSELEHRWCTELEPQWWGDDPKGSDPFAGKRIRQDLVDNFYVLGGALDRLQIVLCDYPKQSSRLRPRQRKDARVRELLGWHAKMLISWQIWFFGLASVGAGGELPRQFEEARSRLKTTIQRIGDHSTNDKGTTIKESVSDELSRWHELARVHDRSGQISREAKKVGIPDWTDDRPSTQ